MILCIDLGNHNIKTSMEEIFTSKFTVSTNNDYTAVGEEVLEFSGKTYIMGKGEFENIFNKAEKNYLPNLLYAIHLSTSEKIKDIQLCLGVPLDNVAIKERFKENLKNKTFKFKVNDIERDIIIDRLGVIPEGFSSYYVLSKEDQKQDCIIFDFGSRTTNVCSFVNQKVDKKFTINTGILNLFDSIKLDLNSKGENYEIKDVERLIKNNAIDNLDQFKNDFVKDILNQVEFRIKKEMWKTFDLYATGGGSITLKDSIKETIPDIKFMKNPLFTNVMGNLKICTMKWESDNE